MFRVAGIAFIAIALAGCASTSDPNYDAAGNYIGCHGLGCEVDPVGDDGVYIDPRPQFDSEGNPNFDEDGNWIGCRGPGCD